MRCVRKSKKSVRKSDVCEKKGREVWEKCDMWENVKNARKMREVWEKVRNVRKSEKVRKKWEIWKKEWSVRKSKVCEKMWEKVRCVTKSEKSVA